MKLPFTYYLHDEGSRHETAEEIHRQIAPFTDLSTEDIVELAGRPFYEVTLMCEFDTETGEVTLLKTIL
jgi:hypothetical protein